MRDKMKYIFSCGGTTIEGQAAKKWSQLQPGPYSWDDSRLAKKMGVGHLLGLALFITELLDIGDI